MSHKQTQRQSLWMCSHQVGHSTVWQLRIWTSCHIRLAVYCKLYAPLSVHVSPTASLTANVRFSDNGPVSYEVPLPFENNTVSYNDFLYSGNEDSGMLRGGVGQLVDGVTGTATLDTNEGRFPWVGWSTLLEEIIFDFGSLHQFGSVLVHAYFNSLGVRWFSTIEVAISQNMEQWNAFPRQLNDLHGPQNVMVPTVMTAGSTVEGRYVRLRFDNFQGSGLMLISEVSFNSTAGEFTILITACFHILTHSALFVAPSQYLQPVHQ